VNTLHLIDVMREVHVGSSVFSSSCASYGNPDRLPLTENYPERPINPYGDSKLHWCGRAYGPGSVALRHFDAAGADPEEEIGEDHNPEPISSRWRSRRFLAMTIRPRMGRRFVTLFTSSEGRPKRTWLHSATCGRMHSRFV
jgi:nucleoside-diphosphate-sugar epimerase